MNSFQTENSENNEIDGFKTDFKSENLSSMEPSDSLKMFCSQFLNNSELEKVKGELDAPVMDMGTTENGENDKLKIEDHSPQMPQKVEITLAEYTRLLETERKYN